MAALLDIYIKESTLQTLLETVRKKGEKGVSLTISVNDETDKYGKNVSSYVSQTKEQREAKANRFYTGNGKVFWTDGTVVKAERVDQPSRNETVQEEEQDLLPF